MLVRELIAQLERMPLDAPVSWIEDNMTERCDPSMQFPVWLAPDGAVLMCESLGSGAPSRIAEDLLTNR